MYLVLTAHFTPTIHRPPSLLMTSPFFFHALAASQGCLYPILKAFSTSALASGSVVPPSASEWKCRAVAVYRAVGYPKTMTYKGWLWFALVVGGDDARREMSGLLGVENIVFVSCI